jgi:uncharacterized membrane protein YphA (DoxX/SURF4 family)
MPDDGNWWSRNVDGLKTALRVVFGLVWVIDGALKFTSGFVSGFPGAVQTASGNAPAWLSGWYGFWVPQANANPALIVYTVGILELVLGLALLAGFLRKIAYVGGVALSLLIWAVPEGFGGPYGSGAGGTDVGTGVIYALVFVGLIIINSTFGASRWSLDALIERHWPRWGRIAEFQNAGAPEPGTRRPTGAVGL